MSPDDDYHQALTESETDIRNELGNWKYQYVRSMT